jgi:hypothetical protein
VRPSDTGESLKNLADLFQGFLTRSGSPAKVETLALAVIQPHRPALTWVNRVFRADHYPELMRLWGADEHKLVAPYAPHRIGKRTLADLIRQPAYDQLKQAMRQRMDEAGDLALVQQQVLKLMGN